MYRALSRGRRLPCGHRLSHYSGRGERPLKPSPSRLSSQIEQFSRKGDECNEMERPYNTRPMGSGTRKRTGRTPVGVGTVVQTAGHNLLLPRLLKNWWEGWAWPEAATHLLCMSSEGRRSEPWLGGPSWLTCSPGLRSKCPDPALLSVSPSASPLRSIANQVSPASACPAMSRGSRGKPVPASSNICSRALRLL